MNTKALRQKVLGLAIHGKLVPQNPNDESATVLLEKIRAEKAEKIKKGELKADKKDSFIFTKECEFDEDKLGKCSSGTRHKRHYEQFADGTVKDIEDEIPFDVPEGWAWIRQKNLGIALNGKAFKPSDWTKKGLPIVRIQNLNDKNAPYNYYDKDVDETFLLHGGELLFAWSGTPGTSFGAHIWDKGEAVLNQHIFKILFDETIINKIFYKYCLNNQVEKLIEVAHGSAGLAHITKNMFDEVLIPLPPYNEQLRIVTEFEKIISLINYINDNKTELNDTIKQTKSKILDLAIHGKLVPQDPNDEPAEELLKRIATSDNRPYEKVEDEPFEIPDSWRWVKLTSICNKLVDGDHNPPKSVEEQTEYIMASSRNINYDRLDDLENVRYLSKEVFKIENNRTKAEKGDIFFTSVGTIGRSCIYSGDYNICFQRSVTVLNTNINNQFLKYFFDSNFFQTYVIEHSTGTAQMGFYLKEMANSPIAIPPMHEQARIVDKVSELFYQLDQIQNNLI